MDMKELQRNWELFGRTDPLRAILTGPPSEQGWDEEEFFRRGREDVDAAFAQLNRIRAQPSLGRALDFGCGVGRLTQPLCERFRSVIGVDIAAAMIDLARKYNQFGDRCQYVVNDRDDLSRFPTGSFDFVYSLIVLQHMRPQYSLHYIREFLRVTAPGGIIVFQLPAATKSQAVERLPERAFAAQIELVRSVSSMSACGQATIVTRVTNRSQHRWAQGAPDKPLALNLGNHWRDEHGQMLKLDDGRAQIPLPLEPGGAVEVELRVTAPGAPGVYELELDLVQESVSWFAQRKSPVVRSRVEVAPRQEGDTAPAPRPSEAPSHESSPKMEMYCVPRHTIEQLVRRHGGRMISVIPHHGAGPDYENYQYFVEVPRYGRRVRKTVALGRALIDRVRARLTR